MCTHATARCPMEQHVRDNVSVEIPGVGVQRLQLVARSLHDSRVAVADVTDIVDAIQVRVAIRIVQILRLATNDMQRLRVGDATIHQARCSVVR